jgi:hypothetical protein
MAEDRSAVSISATWTGRRERAEVADDAAQSLEGVADLARHAPEPVGVALRWWFTPAGVRDAFGTQRQELIDKGQAGLTLLALSGLRRGQKSTLMDKGRQDLQRPRPLSPNAP